MRTLFRFITLLLCLELIVSPIAPNFSFIIQRAQAEDCPTGFTFDSTLNRCLTKTETANVMNATMSCGQDVQCYRNNALAELQKKADTEKGSGGAFVSKIGQIAAIAGPVTLVSIGMSTSTASCTAGSFYAMVAGALALVIGDNLANMQHKKRLKEIKEDWGKIVNPEQANGDKDKERETSIEAQSEAFEMLARAEDSLAKASKMKNTFFMVATVAYGASTVLALMEKSQGLAADAALLAASKASEAAQTASSATCPPSAAAAATDKMNIGTDAQNQAYKTALEANVAAKAATPATIPDKSASAQALQVKTLAATRLTTATAVVTAAQAAVAATTPTTCQAAAAALSAALAEQAAAKTAYIVANVNYCPSNNTAYNAPTEKPTSLYSYYINGGSQPDLRKDLQLRYNVENSADLTSFIMNQRELNGELSANPLQEYAELKTAMNNADSDDKDTLFVMKAAYSQALNILNPISSAHADEAEVANAEGLNSETSTSPNQRAINTQAAKAFKAEESKGIDLLSIGIGVAAGYLIAVKTSLGEKLVTPTGRAIFSGVMAGMALIMAQHAKSQADASEKRAELLRKMKDEFKSASGAIFSCKSEDRNDPGKPNCYCYTSENQRNSNRGNSQICQKLWAGVNTNIKSLANAASSSRVCVNQNRQADATCSCRSNNTCMKVSLSSIRGFDPGTMSIVGNGLSPVNKILDGSIDGATLSPASLGSQAAKLAEITKKLENTKGMEGYRKNKAALETKLKNDLARGAASLPSGSMLGGAGGANMPSNPGDAARMLEKELDNSIVPTGVGGNNDFIAAPAPPEENLEFGMTGDQLAAQEGQIAEVMKQDLDYGGNDINQGSKTNIFEVLSNRYQRSGMRRLFDEKGETKPEAASKSDITQ